MSNQPVMNHIKTLIFILCSISQYLVSSQDLVLADSLYDIGRKEALSGNYETARIQLNKALEIEPNYTKVKVLKARTYSWGKNYNEARTLLNDVIQNNPRHVDALSALADVELWSEQPAAALGYIESAITISSNKSALLLKKAIILQQLGNEKEALTTINAYLDLNPADEKAQAIRRDLLAATRNQQVNMTLGLDVFSKTFDPSFYSSIQYLRKDAKLTSVLRVNQVSRFNKTGIQGEIDLYPKFGKKSYGYINYGYSKSILFPSHRVGAEFYTTPAKALDASLGFRYLSFAFSEILIYTGSIGYSLGNYWFSVRPFVTTQELAGAALSLNVQAKKYFDNPENFVGMLFGLGYSPDIRTLQSSGGALQNEIYALISRRVEVYGQKIVSDRWLLTARLAVTRQEQTFELKDYVWITSGIVGVGYCF